MKLTGNLMVLFWLLALGYLCLYVYSFATGLLTPAEVAGMTIGALAVMAVFPVHAMRVRQAMRDHDNPAHEAIMHEAHKYREKRGF